MKLFLVRHGETDWQQLESRGVRGWARSFAPLTQLGRLQIDTIANDYRLGEAEAILCSSYARALESGARLSRTLNKPLYVEYDLHEWLPQKDPEGETDENVMVRATKELTYYTGYLPFPDRRARREVRPPNQERRTPVQERRAPARSPHLGNPRRGARPRVRGVGALPAPLERGARLARRGDEFAYRRETSHRLRRDHPRRPRSGHHAGEPGRVRASATALKLAPKLVGEWERGEGKPKTSCVPYFSVVLLAMGAALK